PSAFEFCPQPCVVLPGLVAYRRIFTLIVRPRALGGAGGPASRSSAQASMTSPMVVGAGVVGPPG
ncbi:MAG TPA: hypothetical protein VFY84_16575, partial [Jiangellales bacterium]|nr:hypothetical protein [Jiangellales bacterium]